MIYPPRNAAYELERLAAKLEAAERDIAMKEKIIDSLGAELNVAAKERDAMRAKIVQMEKQDPVAWMLNCPTLGGDTGWILSWTQSGAGLCNRLSGEENERKLYALPGAQPAPSVPDGWLRAIDEALVVANIGVANESDTYEQAKAKLDSLIGFHVDVATDPAVNGGWKLVPRPPTPTMVKAGLESSHVLNVHRVLACYDAMINAAQCVPSVPECWLPVPEKHPTFDPVDLQLSDGSVLCGCVPQSDGDYWWEGPSGEVFIDPKYASVTHWRLTAAPEAKP